MSDGAASRWLKPILAAWPRPDRQPVPRVVALDELFEELSCPTKAARLEGIDPAIIAFGPGDAKSVVAQIADLMHQRRAPGLLLFPDIDTELAAFEQGGVLIEQWDASADRLAAQLFALTERQATIVEMGLERLRASDEYEGVAGEIGRIHEELSLAASVQRDLLPQQLPEVDGLEFAAMFRPSAYVSGDLYDVVPLPDGRIAFVLADAVGHGVPAALLTMIVNRAVHGAIETSARGELTASHIAERLNDALCVVCSRGQHFATGVCGVLEPATFQVELSVAGHPPPLRLRAGTMERIDPTGPLLGVFADAAFEQVGFRMEPGETLMIYSDGFETAFPTSDDAPGRVFSPQACISKLAQVNDDATELGGIEPAMNRLAELVSQQSGSLHQTDDVTALALSRPAEGVIARPAAA
ncbi:MAG: PP2C family protein-serine/threonine phosphatase [Planctomycetota bacterium]